MCYYLIFKYTTRICIRQWNHVFTLESRMPIEVLLMYVRDGLNRKQIRIALQTGCYAQTLKGTCLTDCTLERFGLRVYPLSLAAPFMPYGRSIVRTP